MTSNSRGTKRKRPHIAHDDSALGISPLAKAYSNRDQSLTPPSSGDESDEQDHGRHAVMYDASVFRRRNGCITPVPDTDADVRVDATTLPTQQMLVASIGIDTVFAEMSVRRSYVAQLLQVQGPPITFKNSHDRETPSLAFRFIDSHCLTDGVNPVEEDARVGCTDACVSTRLCDCFEEAYPDEASMTRDELLEWHQRQADGDARTGHLPKRFPYHDSGVRRGCLVDFYLHSRHVIYECNAKCACDDDCDNRNVQFGRRVSLEIFKTRDRGFGLRSPENIKRGQFIDTYRGEVITDQEATRREEATPVGSAQYFFGLDKFAGDDLRIEDCYVVDGRHMGGPSRFINHSCEPNAQMHSVSYSKWDVRIYDLAFFAAEDIPAYTELTFDYMEGSSKIEGEEDPMVLDGSQHEPKKRVPCHCGAEKCRGFLWL